MYITAACYFMQENFILHLDLTHLAKHQNVSFLYVGKTTKSAMDYN